MVAIYFALSESTLPTTDVKDGRSWDPGAGWITSAPMGRSDMRQDKRIEVAHPSQSLGSWDQ